ncbi:MAG TPA: hypothetical protein VFC82_09920 [Actinomycetaceae bacterium]|nr:hypothetical protein [Actinomycetaceae bacterium]
MDERIQQITGPAGMIALSVGYVYQLVVAIGKFIAARDITAAISEIIFLVLIPIVFVVFAARDDRLMLPRVGHDDYGEMLSPKARRKRTWSYASQSAGLAVAWTILDALANWWIGYREPVNLPEPLFWVIDLMVGFTVIFGLSYLWGEWSTKRYVKQMKELES